MAIKAFRDKKGISFSSKKKKKYENIIKDDIYSDQANN